MPATIPKADGVFVLTRESLFAGLRFLKKKRFPHNILRDKCVN